MTLGQALLTFTVAAGLLTITPGLDTALVLRTAAVEGRNRAMWAGPKVGLFYMAFLPQFVPRSVPVTLFTIGLATIHATEGILWFMLLTSATDYFAAGLRRPSVVKTIDRWTGTMLIGFGIKLAIETRR